jgi:pectate lyase
MFAPFPTSVLRRAFCGLASLALGFALHSATAAQVIEREEAVPPYTLPDLLRMQDGGTVSNATQWASRRRPELLEVFGREVYGRFPEKPRTAPKVQSQSQPILEGRAIRRTLTVDLPDATGQPHRVLRATVILPTKAPRPVPVFVGLHLFDANRPVPTPAVAKSAPSGPAGAETHRKAGETTAERILARGYAFATLELPELAPDSATNWSGGVLRNLFGRTETGPPGPTETGALGVWAWGISRFVDAAALDPDLDATRIIAIGHSRMGKAALWAGANDERIAAVISNDSGCGGAALSRRIFGETVSIITRAFPHWFCGNFQQYADHEDRLPVDQHQLLALIAPRPLYVASAVEDRWADPRGEFLAAFHATPAWPLLGRDLGDWKSPQPPATDQPLGTRLRYHVRAGRHDLTDFDWQQYLDFADQELPAPGRKSATVDIPKRAPFSEFLKRPDSWWRGNEAASLATNILSFQSPRGDWPKNTNTAARPFTGDRSRIEGTWDNGASIGEIRFLARYHRRTSDPAGLGAVERSLTHILEAQYPTGGWPQHHPPGPGYHRHITLNDGTMVHLLELLRDSCTPGDFESLSGNLRQRARAAFDRGVDCLVRSQIKVGGIPTVWCAQHDEVTLEPRPARKFEPISLSGAESAGVLRLLMSLESPNMEVRNAIRAGAAWFARSAIPGIRVVTRDGDRRVETDPGAPPLWARFYEIHSNRPLFTGRDAVVKYQLADIEAERRNGYAWYGTWGEAVARDFAAWSRRHP